MSEPAAKDLLKTLSLVRPHDTAQFEQAVFARYLNVSTKLVQAWEAGRRHPDGPALVLLHIAERQPGLIETVRQSAERRTPRRPQLRTSRHAVASV